MTIVGSWPHRRPLPLGAEANARARRHCEFWRQRTPAHASSYAYREMMDHGVLRKDSSCAGWLPQPLKVMS